MAIYEPLKKSWRIVDVWEDKEVHVIPNHDELEHDDDNTCWCSPFQHTLPDVDDGEWKVMMHISVDGREADEAPVPQ